MSEYRLVATEQGLMPVAEQLSFPDVVQSQPEVGEQPGPHLKFVLWTHTPENTDASVAQLEDCDVVAFEHRAFKDNAERLSYDQAATVLASSTASAGERSKASGIIDKFDYNEGVYVELFKRLAGTDKRIATLDMDRDDPNYNKRAATHRGHVGLADKLSTDELKHAMLDHSKYAATWDEAREARMVEQVVTLADEYTGQNVTIGVMVGAAHTPVRHALHATYPNKQVYASPRDVAQTNQEKIYFDPETQLRRHMRFHPDKPVAEGVLNRAVLKVYEANSYTLSADATLHSRELQDVPDDEIAELLMTLDAMKQGVMATVLRRRTAQKMGAVIAATAKRER